ncbi:Hemicentin-1 [Stylophora pistillata]|uniref:Hemicentin-1 n=1 Tax=Stylophora pistillata TaxID=50429 RepID=A0A2B4R8G3_STYPI|nr:Hemicentin-1 [Stylophora pistillata]
MTADNSSHAMGCLNDFIFFPPLVIPDVEISTSPPTKKLAIGTAVNLTCLAQPRRIDAGYYDRWTEYIQWYDPKGKPVGHRCVQGRRMVLKRRCLLMLKKLTAEQLGSYTCEAGNGYRAHCRRKSVQIRPQEAQTIQIVEDPKNQSAVIDSSITLNCTATGHPRPTISWMKNDDPYALQINKKVEEKVIALDNKTVFSQLLLTRSKMEDNGKYHCVANNSAGKRRSQVAFLYIKDLDAQTVQSVEDSKNQSTFIDFTVNFTYAARGRSKPNISRVKDNDPYPTQSNPNAKHRWNIIIVIGSDLTLSCITTGLPTGHPQSAMRWIKYNDLYDVQSSSRAKISQVRRDQTTHHQLFLEKVKKEDGGIYQCVANNIAGGGTSIEVNLHVVVH